MVAGEKNKNEELGEQMKKRERKGRKMTLKRGKKAFKMYLFGL